MPFHTGNRPSAGRNMTLDPFLFMKAVSLAINVCLSASEHGRAMAESRAWGKVCRQLQAAKDSCSALEGVALLVLRCCPGAQIEFSAMLVCILQGCHCQVEGTTCDLHAEEESDSVLNMLCRLWCGRHQNGICLWVCKHCRASLYIVEGKHFRILKCTIAAA